MKTSTTATLVLAFLAIAVLSSQNNFVLAQGPQIGVFRISNDKPQECADCTFGHATASYIIADLFDGKIAWWKADLITLGIGVMWEVKDSFLPHEKVGLLGGEGFSKWDIVFDATGIVFHRVKHSIVGEKIKIVIIKVPVIRRVIPKKREGVEKLQPVED